MASAIARVSMIAATLILCLAAPAAETPAVSQHDVVPILLRRCAMCHGAHRQEGGLDLRTRSSMIRGGKSGAAISPGKAEESQLIRRVRAGAMPPRDRLVEASVKPIEPGEIETISRWINAGAPETVVAPDVAGTTPDRIVTDADRNFWSFRPPMSPPIPPSRINDPVRNPIDAFLLARLNAVRMSFSPEASRAALMRRVYYDLTGMPASPDEVRRFLADESADAYERLVDRLLASPKHGERWTRPWLDVAGYADSEGKREQDLPRPNAWRYRDYVIRSFNADKPYDRFLMEQIAGDELADYRNAREITPEISDNLIATAFLRMAPDATWANITGYLHDRIEVIADEMEVLGSAVMGLSIHCARCHNHKLEPIPQRDYFRMLDVFKGAFDEHDWLKPDVRPGLGPVSQDTLGGRLLPYVPSNERREWQQRQAAIGKEIADLRRR